jgi:rubrerythrin
MSDKPTYVGLLNAIANAEQRAAEYLERWIAVTPDPAVAAALHSIALREAEHGVAFEKRLDELGFGLIRKRDARDDERMEIASSTTLCDREKFEQLDLIKRPANGESDIFDRFFENKDLDPQTGGLLGRYIAEERDTGRRFAACYEALCAAEDTARI